MEEDHGGFAYICCVIYFVHMMKMSEIKYKWFGNAAFYRRMLKVALPLVISQMITSFVNMLDNIMVGRTGTLQMSGVSIANQINMVLVLALFGAVSAAAIFGAQYAGKEDWDGERICFRYRLIVAGIVSVITIAVCFIFGRQLIMLFLDSETNNASDINETLQYGLNYLKIIAVGMIPFSISTAISSVISETGETRLPMISSVAAVFVNLVFNYLLIFGKFGFPEMGCVGAAVATNISRIVQLCLNLWFAYRKADQMPFFRHVLSDFRIPLDLAKTITIKGLPLMVNEVLWSIGIAAVAQCYSTRGIDAVAAYNIQNTITNLFFVFNIAMGDCISIMVGQELGAGNQENAVLTNTRLIVFTTVLSCGLGAALAVTAHVYPEFYNTSIEIKNTAASLLKVAGWTLWISAIYNAAYFTLRTGGKTIITFLFDSVGTIFVSFPAAFVLAHFTNIGIVGMFFVIRVIDLYKVILGLYLVYKRVWVNDLVSD